MSSQPPTDDAIAILGAGAWGTALAVMLARGGHRAQRRRHPDQQRIEPEQDQAEHPHPDRRAGLVALAHPCSTLSAAAGAPRGKHFAARIGVGSDSESRPWTRSLGATAPAVRYA